MPRGGRRVGAGRKPRAKRTAVVLGIDGSGRQELTTTLAAALTDPTAPAMSNAGSDLLTPPADLTEGQQAFWRLYARHAIEQGTLVPATVAGFRELCEQYSLKQAIAARIEKVKPASKRAEGPLKTYVKLAQRLDSTLARFKLTSLGKPVDGAAARSGKAAPNPWAKVAGR